MYPRAEASQSHGLPDGTRDDATGLAERSYSRYASLIAQERARRAFIFQSDDSPAQFAIEGQRA